MPIQSRTKCESAGDAIPSAPNALTPCRAPRSARRCGPRNAISAGTTRGPRCPRTAESAADGRPTQPVPVGLSRQNAFDANTGVAGPVSNIRSKDSSAGGTTIRELDLLKDHEKAIGRLYAAYARRFPADREFWLGLSREEQQHANWVQSLRSRIEDDPASLVVSRFPTKTIELSLAYVNRLIEASDASSLTRVNALSVALDLERALLEHRYFEVFSSEDPQIRRTLQLLRQSTQTHLQKVQHLWEACTQPAS